MANVNTNANPNLIPQQFAGDGYLSTAYVIDTELSSKLDTLFNITALKSDGGTTPDISPSSTSDDKWNYQKVGKNSSTPISKQEQDELKKAADMSTIGGAGMYTRIGGQMLRMDTNVSAIEFQKVDKRITGEAKLLGDAITQEKTISSKLERAMQS